MTESDFGEFLRKFDFFGDILALGVLYKIGGLGFQTLIFLKKDPFWSKK